MAVSEATLVDTHAHLCDQVFAADIPQVLQRAHAKGLTKIIAVGEDLNDARRNLELSEDHGTVLPAAGLYPTRLDPEEAGAMIDFIRRERHRLAAIGEVGLDYWHVREEAQRDMQRFIFSSFIDLSKELDLPLNVHSRSAGKHAIALLLERCAARVQLHAYDGKAAGALEAVEAGYFFSVPPSVIRSQQKQKLLRRLPLSCLLLESDSPVLGPDPQERNEPANITLVVDALSRIKGCSPGAVLKAVSENTKRLYGRNLIEGGSAPAHGP